MNRGGNRRRLKAAALGAAVLIGTTGCSGYENLNSLSLPGGKGMGPGAYTVRVELANGLNLVPNTPVMVGDINVGTIRSIELDGWTAEATISLEPDVKLPENAIATIGQTSLLGAKHIELAPPTREAPTGALHDGDVIPLSRSGHYPETEDVLAAVATLLNGGGLAQLKTITTELNKALGGNEGSTRDLLNQVNTLATGLDQQKGQISAAIDSLDHISTEFQQQNPVIDEALAKFPLALNVLNNERQHLVDMLSSLGDFGTQITSVLNQGEKNLVTNIAALRPVLKGLADSGSSLYNSLYLLGTVAFPLKTFGDYIRGDYINLWATVDLGLDSLDRGLLSGTPLEGALGGVQGLLGQLLGLAGRADNPLTAPAVPPPAPATAAPAPQAGGTAPAPQAGVPTGGAAMPPSPSPSAAPPVDPNSIEGLLGSLLGAKGGTP